jgi:hypothetical protein
MLSFLHIYDNATGLDFSICFMFCLSTNFSHWPNVSLPEQWRSLSEVAAFHERIGVCFHRLERDINRTANPCRFGCSLVVLNMKTNPQHLPAAGLCPQCASSNESGISNFER